MKILLNFGIILIPVLLLANLAFIFPAESYSTLTHEKPQQLYILSVVVLDSTGVTISSMLEHVGLILVNTDTGQEYLYNSNPPYVFNGLLPGNYTLTAIVRDTGGTAYSTVTNISIDADTSISVTIPRYVTYNPLDIPSATISTSNASSIQLKAFTIDTGRLPGELKWAGAADDLWLDSPSTVMLVVVNEHGIPVSGANISGTGNGQYLYNISSSSGTMVLYYKGGLSCDIFKADFKGLSSNEIAIHCNTMYGLYIGNITLSDYSPSQFETIEVSCNIRNLGDEGYSGVSEIRPLSVYPEYRCPDGLFEPPDTITLRINEEKLYTKTIYCEEPGMHIAFIGDRAVRFNVSPIAEPALRVTGRNETIGLMGGDAIELAITDMSEAAVPEARVYVGSMLAGQTGNDGKISLIFPDENAAPGYLVRVTKEGYRPPRPLIIYVKGNSNGGTLPIDGVVIHRDTSTVPSDSRRVIDLLFYASAGFAITAFRTMCDVSYEILSLWYIFLGLILGFVFLLMASRGRNRPDEGFP